ncbi:MAG: DUF4105 domain-containing protein [Verrucomicrobiales bacterium]
MTAAARFPRIRRALIAAAIALVATHAMLALLCWISLPTLVRWGAAGIVAGTGIGALMRRGTRLPLRPVAIASILVVEVAFLFKSPAAACWKLPQENGPTARIAGNEITIENFRYAKHRNPDEVAADVEWLTKTVDVSQIESVELVIQNFAAWEGLAHAMVTFRQSSGEHIAFSVEARIPAGRGYHPLPGLFKAFQLIVIIGDERDLLWKRLIDPAPRRMVIFPVDVTREQAQDYFVSLVRRADALTRHPEFYDTLRANCMTTLVATAPDLDRRISALDYRLAVPGYSDELFRELGLIHFEGSRDETHRRYSVPAEILPPDECPDPASWSRQLRTKG